MTPLTVLLLLALGAETKPESHYPGASAVFQCMFDVSQDEDIHGWPPGWTRRHGPGFPRYVHVRVDSNHPPVGGRCLRVELNGGAAVAYGPAVSVNPDVQYVLEGYVETAGLQHDKAYLSLIFLDSARTKLSSVVAQRIGGTNPWQKVRLGPMLPPAGASSLLVGLHVEPQSDMEDLRGTASFGALWLGQVPRVVLTAQPVREIAAQPAKADRNWADGKQAPSRTANDAPFLLFPRGRPIEIACVVSGFAAPTYEIRLELLDVGGRKIAEHQQSFSQSQPAVVPLADESGGVQTNPKRQRGNELHPSLAHRVSVGGDKSEKPSASPFGRTTWRLPGDSAGFYRVRATVMSVATSVRSSSTAAAPVAESTSQAELSLAVIDPQPPPSGSEFGWSLSPNDAGVGLAPLGDLLCECGVGRVKFPFSNGSTANSLDSLINFSDRLDTAGVGLTGVLQPPKGSGDAADLLAAEVFSRDPKSWYPTIEPILARLGTQIRFWQIGDDRDPGWIGCDDLPGIVSRTKAELDRIGQDISVGMAWNLAAPMPTAGTSSAANRSNTETPSLRASDPKRQTTPWRFMSFPCDDAIGIDAIARCLDGAKSTGVARWIVFDALPRDGHATRDRIAHLVDRMLTAKMHGAEAIFVSNPFDPDRGLVDRSGSPGELFLPWRTTALMLGGAPYAGDIDLPHGNQIHCFGDTKRFVGVLAGRKPGQETVYLGSELRMYDLWGNSRACPPTLSNADGTTSAYSLIPVEQLPTFLTGLDGPITLWQLGVNFSPHRLPSVPSATVPVVLKLKNTFPQSITARVAIQGPRNWLIEPRTAEIRLAPGSVWQKPLEVTLPNDVTGGRQSVRLDFEIQADRLYRFTMCRPLEVTLDDVTFDGRTVLNTSGEMEVYQTLTNLGQKPASFRCDLLAPDRRRQSTEVLIQPSSKSQLTYRLPDGDQLLGKAIWLRAEEIDGPRVLNYRIEPPATAIPLEQPKHRQPSRPGSSLML